ncbi:hypothetical protein [Burkholderia ubonensis]|uniref:hypothetical protein n=1 Tax=Burkholderia ubonensis TaxID=101571 RepID=UPI0012BA840D|nr:hypothetical protein [Burkholderia ubonensis]
MFSFETAQEAPTPAVTQCVARRSNPCWPPENNEKGRLFAKRRRENAAATSSHRPTATVGTPATKEEQPT